MLLHNCTAAAGMRGMHACMQSQEEAAHACCCTAALTLGVMPVPYPGERGAGQPAEQAAGLGGVVQAAHNVLCVARKEKGRET